MFSLVHPLRAPYFAGAFSRAPIKPTFWRSESSERVIDPAWEMAAQAHLPPAAETITRAAAQRRGVAHLAMPSGQMPLLRAGGTGGCDLPGGGRPGWPVFDRPARCPRTVLFEKWMRQHEQTVPAQALLSPALWSFPPNLHS